MRKLLEKFGLKKSKKKMSVPPMNYRNLMRFLFQQRIYNMIHKLDGDVVECGLGHGTSLLGWCYLAHEEGTHRHVWGFDSFKGFPEPTEFDGLEKTKKKAGDWAVGSLNDMMKKLSMAGLAPEWLRIHLTLVEGFFQDSLVNYKGKEIALLFIDADLYDSYKTVLEQLYSKVQRGGIIAFDEYAGTLELHKWPGAKRAVDEFFADKNVEIQFDKHFCKYYVIKP
jgi:hypothetical protein